MALALGVVYVLWGSTYLGIRVALDDMPATFLGGVRFLIAGALLYAWAGRGMGAAERPTRRHVIDAAIIGVLLLGVANGAVILAELRVPTGVVALLVASVPLWIALLARVVLREQLSALGVASLAVGFGGVALLIGPGRSGGTSLLAMALTLLSPLAWSIGSLYGRAAAPTPRPLVGVALQMLAAGVVLSIVAVIDGDLGRVSGATFGWRPLLALAYLVTFGSIFGYTAYAWLLQHAPISLVSTYAYVNPLVAVLLGRVFLGEEISAGTLLGGLIIAVAVALIVASPQRRAATAAAPVRSPAECLDAG